MGVGVGMPRTGVISRVQNSSSRKPLTRRVTTGLCVRVVGVGVGVVEVVVAVAVVMVG